MASRAAAGRLERRHQDERVRRTRLAAKLRDIRRRLGFEQVWIDAPIHYQTLLAVAMRHDANRPLERVAERATQRRS
jgi:hypothetical protein